MLTDHRICFKVYQTFVSIKLYVGTYREATWIKVIENSNLVPRVSLLCFVSPLQQRMQRGETLGKRLDKELVLVVQMVDSATHQAPVVETMDSPICGINHYPVDK